MINKGRLKFSEEKEIMVKFLRKKELIMTNEDSFPLASVNTISFDLKTLIDSKKVGGPRIKDL